MLAWFALVSVGVVGVLGFFEEFLFQLQCFWSEIFTFKKRERFPADFMQIASRSKHKRTQ